MSDTNDDQELRAIQHVIAALSDLNSEARARIIGYVIQGLGSRRPRPPLRQRSARLTAAAERQGR